MEIVSSESEHVRRPSFNVIVHIYIGPLLMMIRRMTRGLALSLVQQKDDDYCDDVNFIGERK